MSFFIHVHRGKCKQGNRRQFLWLPITVWLFLNSIPDFNESEFTDSVTVVKSTVIFTLNSKLKKRCGSREAIQLNPDKQRGNGTFPRPPNMLSPAHLAKRWSSLNQRDMPTQEDDDSPGKWREEKQDEIKTLYPELCHIRHCCSGSCITNWTKTRVGKKVTAINPYFDYTINFERSVYLL